MAERLGYERPRDVRKLIERMVEAGEDPLFIARRLVILASEDVGLADPQALPIAVASTASYLLILWVFRHAAIAPAAALRDTSSIFAVVIAIVWLREPFTGLRLFAILLSAAAVPLLRLS